MKRIKKQSAKALNITTIVLEILFEIILLPLYICKAIVNISNELRR
ncbi:MAG: hypothetical protein IJQ07_05175 [Clostridia bacterium]|nr:hypothetical protein [Clostridia bacterium]